jgi:hypothetical protein
VDGIGALQPRPELTPAVVAAAVVAAEALQVATARAAAPEGQAAGADDVPFSKSE